jgi:hypothetical protein
MTGEIMNIIWNKNPLATVIELNDYEKQILALKLKIESHEESLFSAWFYLTDEKCPDMERVKEELNPKGWMEEDQEEGESHHYQKMVDYCIAELAGVHGGDCTCVPCSCLKCHAEDMIGVNTIKGLGKHGGHTIDAIFRENPDISLAGAIEKLENYNPVIKEGSGWEKRPEEFASYIPRWREQSLQAAKWLREYGLLMNG